MRLSRAARQEFVESGRRGGQARARSMTPDARSAVARLAAIRRWTRARFGDGSFARLAFPGGEILDQGLADLAAGLESVESLLVCIAAPRLRREGVPLPACTFEDPESRLYARLAQTNPGLAHARYLAYLSQAASFADACRSRRAA